MKKILQIFALIAPISQFAMSIVSIYVTDFVDLRTKYGLLEELYLQPFFPAFLIWNVIFLSFIALGIYQLKSSLLNESKWVNARPYIISSCVGNIVWFLGDFNINLSFCLIGFSIMLYSLIKLNNIFTLGVKSKNKTELWLIKFPTSIFFGWITVAYPLGVTLWIMTFFNVSGNEILTPQIWSAVVVVVAFFIFAGLYWIRKVSSIFVLTGIWGLFWIAVASQMINSLIGIMALVAFVLLILLVIWVKVMGKTPRLGS